jgi:hypothetical protein
MRAEAPALDRHLWETHLQVAELAALRDRTVEAWRGRRWDLHPGPDPALLLAGPWAEPELRWVLEAAGRDCRWPREPDLLRDLAAWMLPHLGHKPKKIKEWGGWQLAPADPATPGAKASPERPWAWALRRGAGPGCEQTVQSSTDPLRELVRLDEEGQTPLEAT